MSGLDLKRELRHMIITKLKCQVFFFVFVRSVGNVSYTNPICVCQS